MLRAFRARAMKGLSRRAVLVMIGAAAAMLAVLTTAFSGASAAPPPCDPGGTWFGAFSSTSTDPIIKGLDNGTVKFTITTQKAGEGDDNEQGDEDNEQDDDNSGQPGGPVHFEFKTDEVLPSKAVAKGDGVLRLDKTFEIKGHGTIASAPPGYNKFHMVATGKVALCNSNNSGHANSTSETLVKLTFVNAKKDTVTIPELINQTYPPFT
jgi:hypothetical protein